jgi:hypothetical protein
MVRGRRARGTRAGRRERGPAEGAQAEDERATDGDAHTPVMTSSEALAVLRQQYAEAVAGLDLAREEYAAAYVEVEAAGPDRSVDLETRVMRATAAAYDAHARVRAARARVFDHAAGQ